MDLPAHWITELFKKWQGRYGNKWLSAIEGIEKIAVAEWSEQLAGLTGEQIKHGLDSWTEDWPPSAPEFKKICLGHDEQKGLSHNTAAYREFKRNNRLLEKQPDPEIAKSALDEMKEKLGIK